MTDILGNATCVCAGFGRSKILPSNWLNIEGAFHNAWPTGQRPVELTKGKWNDIVQ